MDEDFPRGGVQTQDASGKQKNYKKEKNLFQANEPDTDSTKKRKRRNKKDDKTDGPSKKQKKHKIEGEVTGQGSTLNPQYLSKKMLYPGMLMLGCVKQIQDYKLIVTLPNGLSGIVPINQISRAYTESLQRFSEAQDENAESVSTLSELFHTGMLVPCKLTEQDGDSDNKMLPLTINPQDVNGDLSPACLRHGMIVYGNISSVEDHGYIVDIGVKGVQVFLKNKQADRFIRLHNNGDMLKVGRCIMCKINMHGDRMSVLSGQTRVIHVTIDPVKLNSFESANTQELKFSSLVPGMKVQATVIKTVREDGIIVEFNKMKGLIHKSHLPAAPDTFTSGQQITCTVLYIHPLVKNVTLSHLPHLVEYVGVPISVGKDLHIGDIVEEAIVKRADNTQGVYLELAPGTLGFAGKTSLSDEKVDKISVKYRAGSKHRCRILGYSYMEGYMYVSMKQSVLEEKHLRVGDIQCGELVECVIKKITHKGLSVDLQKGIRGFIHNMHLADVTIQHPEKKFTVGQKLKCRVLNIYKDSSHVDLTHKKSLVSSKYKIVNDYHQVETGETLEGYISQIRDTGCIVRFYDRVRGYVPKSLLSTELVEYPEKVFYLGQIVRCKVIKVVPDNSKLILSFVIEGRPGFGQKQNLPSDYKAGHKVKCVVKHKSETGIDVTLSASNKTAFIPREHLSDSMEMCNALWDKYQPDDTIDEAIYWNKAKMAILTCKQSLISAAQNMETFVTQFDSLQPGMMLTGSIKNITAYGVFVAFADGLFGLVPRQYAADSNVTDLNALYHIGQTVSPKVVEVHKEKKRFLASLRMQDCFHGNTDIGLDLTWSMLVERINIQQSLTSAEGIRGTVSGIKFGSVHQVTITQLTDVGALGELDSGVPAAIVHDHIIDGVKVGDKLNCVVLFVDNCQNCVEVSLNQKLVNSLQTPKKKTGKDKCHLNQTVNSVIQLVKEDFVVVSLPTSCQLAFIPAKRHWNDVLERQQYGIGQENKVVIKRIENNIILASLKTHEDSVEEDIIDQYQSAPSHTLQIGDICDATVRKVYKDTIYITIGMTNGCVHVTEILDHLEANGTRLTSQYKKKQKLKVRVIGFKEGKTSSYPSIKRTDSQNSLPECSLKPSVLKMETVPADYMSNKKINIGDSVIVLATKMSGGYLWTKVSPSVHGKVHKMNIPKEVLKSTKSWDVGRCYNAKVINQIKDDLVELTLKVENNVSEEIFIGQKVRANIISARLDTGLTVKLPGGYKGIVDITDLSDNYVDFSVDNYKGSIEGVILDLDRSTNQAVVSLRPVNSKPVDRRISSLSDLSPGQLVRGYITRASERRLIVRLGVGIQGEILPTNLINDRKVIGMSSFFKLGKVVMVKIIGIGANKVHISLKKTDTGVDLNIPDDMIKPRNWSKKLDRKRTVSASSVDLESGVESKKMKLKNTDRTVNENVKLEIIGCELMGDDDMCSDITDITTSVSDDEYMELHGHDVEREPEDDGEIHADYQDMIDNLCDEPYNKPLDSDTESSSDDSSLHKVKVKNLTLIGNKVKRKQVKGKKSSVKESSGVEDSDSSSECKHDIEDKRKRKKRTPRHKSDVADKVKTETVRKVKDEDDDDDTDSSKESDSGVDVQIVNKQTDKAEVKPVLDVTEKFSWDTEFKMPVVKCLGMSVNQEESSTDDDDDDNKKPVKKTREEIREAKIAEEKNLYEAEMKRLEGDVRPETVDDFDRLALESPNSSIIWLRYMAFHLETTEIDRARAVAERALKTISFREEQEKLNVWVAYLNLENMYGTPDTVKKVLDRAVQQNDQITVYLKMINVYVTSGKLEDAEHLFNILVKKYSGNKDIWIKFGDFYFTQERIESARKLLQRALKSLDMKLHVDIITKFAVMEFKLGEAERGKTMFENILSTYPKRIDLWSVYIDMVTKLGDHNATRAVYNRAVAQKMSAKKMKFFFKKYLQFEERYGSEDDIAMVKRKALEYVESQGYVDDV